MVVKCCVTSCKIQSDDPDGSTVSFHILPSRESLRKEWMQILNKHLPSIHQKRIYVCSRHFDRECFQYTGLCKKRMLKSGSIPTVFDDFEIVKFEAQRSRKSTSPEIQSNCDKLEFNSISSMHEPIALSSKDFNKCEGDCQSNANNCETHLTNENQVNPSERLLDNVGNNAGNVDETKLQKCMAKIQRLQRQNRNLIIKLGRCKKKMYRFKYLFETLRRKKYISEDESAALQKSIPKDGRTTFENIINSRRSKASLPSSLLKFACTLDFYSPKAYDYVRRTYMKCLPHQKTISRWYRKVHIDSGISKAAIESVRNKVNESTYPLFGNLVFDEISLKKKIETVNGIEYGYVDVGKGEAADNSLVCMLVCINGSWKIPISYYFITSLNGKEKRDIVDETLKALNDTGVKIVSLTFDGPKSNLSMCNLLGANLNLDGQIQNHFPHPITNEPIFVILDACHSLKSVRNSIGKGDKDMYDSEGNVISWSYFTSSISLQTRHAELYVAHKMTLDHINWEQNIMNVRLAAQTLSQSVSDALHYSEYKTDICEFQGAAGTSKFCKIMNDAFDILNSRTLFTKNPSKNGITSDNIEDVGKKVQIIINYIKDLKYLDGEEVVHSRRKTGFIGIILGLHSVVAIFKHYIKQEIVNGYLLTYKLSQDHLEIFFSAVRSKGGYNNNPTCRLFISIFKQLLLHADIKGSNNGNCLLLDDTALLKISSDEAALTINNNQENLETLKNIHPTKLVLTPQNKFYVHDAVCYTAGFICRKILKSSNCFVCPIVLTHQPAGIDESNKSIDYYRTILIDIKNRGGLIYPAPDVITICKVTENIFKSYYSSKKGILRQLVRLSVQNIPRSCLQFKHSISDKVDESSHRFQVITRIVSIYLQMRINRYEKQKQKPKRKIRRLYTKYILFNHE